MNLIFDLGHPAHVHVFKNIIWNLIEKDHNIKIAIRERENMVGALLKHYGFKYDKMHPSAPGIGNKIFTMFNNDLKLLKISKSFSPDMFISLSTPYSAQVSAIMGKPHIGLDDTEDLPKGYLKMIVPFTDIILTPDCFLGKLPEKKQIKYPGYHELTYLHPNHFKPDPSVLEVAGLSKNDQFIIVRFSSWDAYHDIGQKVFGTMDDRVHFIKTLEKIGKIFITSEISLPKSLEKYRLNISPENIHSFLWYSSMYIGEGATLASEAGVLGVPWIWVCGKERRGYLIDQEKHYGLGYNIITYDRALNKAIELFEDYSNVKKEWQERRKKLLKDKIDVTKFLVWLIENYPLSQEKIRENPNFITKFK